MTQHTETGLWVAEVAHGWLMVRHPFCSLFEGQISEVTQVAYASNVFTRTRPRTRPRARAEGLRDMRLVRHLRHPNDLLKGGAR